VSAGIASRIPAETRDWLLSEENPAVAVLTRWELLGEESTRELDALWARRNEYPPVARILDLMADDGSWAPPPRDYAKYGGSLWQIHFLGELSARGDDERVKRAAEYAFSRQLADGSWSCSNARQYGSLPCLTANVGRALARLGYERDERVIAALRHCVALYRELGVIGCRELMGCQLNGYCHMLTPKLLLFLAEVPSDAWPDGAEELRDECIAKLRDTSIFRSLPEEAREFQEAIHKMPAAERLSYRDRFLSEHSPLHYKEKPGWLKFGYPLSYNSDVLEALYALALHGEPMRREYAEAFAIVRDAADEQMRWTLRTTFNGKMLADVEKRGQPSRWLTLRALLVMQHFAEGSAR
jgi:hypothetical protein